MASKEAEDLADQLGGIKLDTKDTEATTGTNSTKPAKNTKRAQSKKHTSKDTNAQNAQISVKEATHTGNSQADSTAYIPPRRRKKHGSIHTNNAGPQSTAQLNANAPAYQPQAPPARYTDYKSSSIYPQYNQGGVSLQQRPPVIRSNKADTTTLNGTTNQRSGPAASTRALTGRIKVPWAQRNIPRKHMMERPTPTAEYLEQAKNAPELLSSPRSLLVILDLNGTLLHRPQKGGTNFLGRPHMTQFLQYLLQKHAVMVWSSSRPKNVEGMTRKLFDDESKGKLIATWNRDDLRLSAAAYNEKVQVYKQLSWIWENQAIQLKHPDRTAQTNSTASWSQADTVLIDDSIEKAASEPHNIIELEEFRARDEQMCEDVLGRVVTYLEKLRCQKDVSAYMRVEPFVFDRVEVADWASLIKVPEA